jgi:hypothetical protein
MRCLLLRVPGSGAGMESKIKSQELGSGRSFISFVRPAANFEGPTIFSLRAENGQVY